MTNSIICPTYDNLAVVARLAQNLAETQTKAEMIFILQPSPRNALIKEIIKSYLPLAFFIENQENTGWTGGINQGLKTCTGDNIILLNDDVILPSGWLDTLCSSVIIAEEQGQKHVGLCGVLSNNTRQDQKINLPDARQLDAYNKSIQRNHDWEETEVLSFFCVLVRRELYEKIGGLDDRFFPGGFDDDDYCLRAEEAEFDVIFCPKLFVWHDHATTLDRFYPDLERGWKNYKIYLDKWMPKLLKEKSPDCLDISLAVVMRDETDHIDGFLMGCWPWVREIVVVDTGSGDDSMERAKAYTDKIFRIETDDLSVARNEAVKSCTHPWVLSLDVDEMIPEDDSWMNIRKFIQDSFRDAYSMTIDNLFPGGQRIPQTNIRLFRPGKGSWVGAVHEYWQPADGCRVEVFPDNLCEIVHFGYIKERVGKRGEVYLQKIKKDLESRPKDGFLWFEKATCQIDLGDLAGAEKSLGNAVHFGYPVAYKSLALINLKRSREHLERLVKALPEGHPVRQMGVGILNQIVQIQIPIGE